MSLPVAAPAIPPMLPEAIDKVRQLEQLSLGELPQIDIGTRHIIHGGMYSRTICIPAGCVLTGALIKVPTQLVIEGEVTVFVGDDSLHIAGYQVLAASAGRKQAFMAHRDTWLTMVFPTTAQSVDQAEREFTDEYELLASHHSSNDVVITGE